MSTGLMEFHTRAGLGVRTFIPLISESTENVIITAFKIFKFYISLKCVFSSRPRDGLCRHGFCFHRKKHKSGVPEFPSKQLVCYVEVPPSPPHLVQIPNLTWLKLFPRHSLLEFTCRLLSRLSPGVESRVLTLSQLTDLWKLVLYNGIYGTASFCGLGLKE